MKSPLHSLIPMFLLAAAGAAPLAFAADEGGNIKARVEQLFPEIKVEQVTPTPYPGLYEIFASGLLLYSDEKVSYLLQGTLIDGKNRQNVSAERLRQLTAITFDQLPLDLSIKVVKGSGKRRMAVFEDPDCPFCRQLEQELSKVDDVTIHVFLYPIEKLHRGATEKSRRIWCAKDQAKAWQEAVLSEAPVADPGDCETPLKKIADFSRRLRIEGTPTVFFADGKRIAGAMSAARVEQLLGEATPEAPPEVSTRPAL